MDDTVHALQTLLQRLTVQYGTLDIKAAPAQGNPDRRSGPGRRHAILVFGQYMALIAEPPVRNTRMVCCSFPAWHRTSDRRVGGACTLTRLAFFRRYQGNAKAQPLVPVRRPAAAGPGRPAVLAEAAPAAAPDTPGTSPRKAPPGRAAGFCRSSPCRTSPSTTPRRCRACRTGRTRSPCTSPPCRCVSGTSPLPAPP